MREYKFRGKTDEMNGWWTYGNLVICDNGDYQIGHCPRYGDVYYRNKVIAETVGQYTGLDDKKGKEIYEGDIVEYANRYKYIVCSGEYNTNPKHCTEAIILGIYLKEIKIGEVNHLYCINGVAAKFPVHCAESEIGIENFKLEVIGNIYEDKELLEG